MPVVETEHTGESRDGQGSGDHDVAYVFGNPRACLTLLCQARLTVMRGYVLDASHAPPTGRYGGDTDKLYETASGLLVPVVPWPDEA